jgi:polyisoprenoid-binding protein YceI
MVSTVRGEFRKLSGEVTLDETDPSKSRVSVALDAASVDTGNEQRDGHLRSGDFFDVEKHPTLTFASKSVKKAGDGLEVTGDLNIRGISKEVVLKVDELTDAITDPWGNQRRGAHATTSIDRKDFGLTFNQTLDKGGVAIADKVNITIEVELVQRKV